MTIHPLAPSLTREGAEKREGLRPSLSYTLPRGLFKTGGKIPLYLPFDRLRQALYKREISGSYPAPL